MTRAWRSGTWSWPDSWPATSRLRPRLVETAAQTRLPGYDKKGEYHYNVISAFIKSMRGSDATAALYYLARMLQAGEDAKFIARRMVIFASEDIGLAAPAALNLAVSTFLAVERIGLPEAKLQSVPLRDRSSQST